MNLLEVKNNLVKIAYNNLEMPILGRFIVIASAARSYVAQFVNLKSDTINNFAIARLLFTFSQDGVVDNYDGSVPSLDSSISDLSSQELLDLLPMETPIKIGYLAQQDCMLQIDESVFERNFTIFVEKDTHKEKFVSNCVRQLFQQRERSVIIDTCNVFEDYPKIEIAKDFKLPLNSEMINYIFEYELKNIEPSIKSVVQEIFYEVQQYINSLEDKFIPIDNFVDVVAMQYKETQMPELALLKNKLQKYRDAGIFANEKEEFAILTEKLNQRNCTIVDVKDVNEVLQKEVISYVHDILASIEKYIYFFVPLTDDNSDKKLLKKLVNNNHVFTTLLASNSYKYVSELKQHAQNMMIFAPLGITNEFSSYNTFITKLNENECVVVGNLTQGIPFIVDINDLELDLTKEDVYGDRHQFFPVIDDVPIQETVEEEQEVVQEEVNESEAQEEETAEDDSQSEPEAEVVAEVVPEEEVTVHPSAVAPLKNILANDIEESTFEVVEDDEVEQVEDSVEDVITQEEEPIADEDLVEEESIEEELPDENDIVEEVVDSEEPIEEQVIEEEIPDSEINSQETVSDDEELQEDDLDFLDDLQDTMEEPEEEALEDITADDDLLNSLEEDNNYVEENVPTVPIYPAEETNSEENIDDIDLEQGDTVTHARYGRGVIEKIMKYGDKTLCSISFENVGRRLLDPTISEIVKL